MKFEVLDFGKDVEINETQRRRYGRGNIPPKTLGDYNITKYGKTLVLENKGYTLQLKRI